ncbi:uncharacterized protein [Palaemon carinicauda]|uniref:uncharacterized protein n=1 Tax=Palaemon carinicauda TaxID=392227 RepID=UPI0035B59A6C
MNKSRDLIIKLLEQFTYLPEVVNRRETASGNWRGVGGEKKIPIKLEVKLYSTVTKPVLMYGSEVWALRLKEAKLVRKEMKIPKWIMEISLRVSLDNYNIRRLSGIVNTA